ncbi:basic amino acid transporter, putative [Cryptococcus deneoformans JEC21]|uniref:Protein BTN1 n=1 Tax=Cryptococcus deneoformans (strain JEC21 / ATCC MYA-565) TaxID=214684 RepID=BTN1_CRYD1|nr:basic amino acid transporter, putative [Cryptococcus neoformans var. neoformans JEC21]P0CM42.1 RecName: Full=Protein BTN1 [Cryptococcus neoformans var. neoformans JEC21]AAW44170.1 basic amino acid transporter, putative [Cryptococcus neoformans var. neoformans JEC21]
MDKDNQALDELPMLTGSKHANKRLFAAFMIFGLLNNVLYVIILSAALDLVSADTPKGVVALFNIFPALITKVVWPLLSNGKIRYTRRVGFCTICSWFGIITIALSSSLSPRLLGISLASLSSGMGELTFLQLTTTLPTEATSKTALGAWSSGTGFAGVAGAGIWWLLRGLGVKGGLGLSSFLPLFFPITYKYILPPFSHLEASSDSSPYQRLPMSSSLSNNNNFRPPAILISVPSSEYVPQHTPLLSSGFIDRDRDRNRDGEELTDGDKRLMGMRASRLTTQEKMKLLRPLVVRYMLPLCAVYVEEYVINSGVAPTLVFPLPTYGLWSWLFKSPRDYYPFWSLTYQTFVFLSRSSLSLGLPPIPKRLLPLPAIIQFLVLSLLFLQAKTFFFSSPAYTPPADGDGGVDRSITIVFLLICLEGLCGGSGYVNTFYHVGREGSVSENYDADGDNEMGGDRRTVNVTEMEKKAMEREFRIGAVGAADSTGILFASLISMPLEIALCRSQVDQGRTMCREL